MRVSNEYAIMSRDFKAYFSSPSNTASEAMYDRYRDFVLTKGSVYYDTVLVRHKYKSVGFNASIRLNVTMARYFLKPKKTVKCKGKDISIEWMGFTLRFFVVEEMAPVCIVKDFCRDVF